MRMPQPQPTIERTPIIDLYLQTVRKAKPPRSASLDQFSDWVGNDFAPTMVAVALEQYHKHHGLREEDARPAGFVGGCVAAVLTAAIYHSVIVPQLRTLRRYGILLTASLVCLLIAGAYLWAVGDAASFGFFAAVFFPGVIGVGLTIAKCWKTYAEGRKALAEARKIEKELENS